MARNIWGDVIHKQKRRYSKKEFTKYDMYIEYFKMVMIFFVGYSSFYLEKDGKLLWNQLHGKELSYNNYFDIESAINIVYQFNDISCSIIKHSNPCGFGIGNNNLQAYLNALSTDPVSYFGGIVGFVG